MIMSMITQSGNSQKYVGVEISPATLEVANGKEFFLSLSLKPSEGIHLNAEPPVTIKSADSVKFSIDSFSKTGEYLDSSKPLRVKCIASGLKSGTHTVIVEITYTYCSSKEGWCRMAKDRRSIDLRVKS